METTIAAARAEKVIRGAWGTLAAITLARVAFGYQVQTVASLGPDLLVTFGITLATLGTIIGLYLLPGVAAALPFGLLGRRFGERPVVAAGLGLMTLGSLLCAASGSVSMLGAGRALGGAGAVALTVLQGKIIADRFDGPRFTLAMSLLVGAFPVGIAIAQLTQSRLAAAFGWPAAFLAGAVISAASLVLFVTTWHGTEPGLRRTLRLPSARECRLVLVAGLIWMFYNAAYFNVLAFMPTYLVAHGHPHWQADVVMSLATWGNLPAILFGSAIAARIGPDRVIAISTVTGVVAVCGLWFADWPLLLGGVFGTVASVPAGLIVAAGTLSARPENRAIGMALFYVAYYIGGFVIPTLCGRAADLAGDPAGAFVCAGLLSSLALPFWALHRRMSRQ